MSTIVGEFIAVHRWIDDETFWIVERVGVPLAYCQSQNAAELIADLLNLAFRFDAVVRSARLKRFVEETRGDGT